MFEDEESRTADERLYQMEILGAKVVGFMAGAVCTSLIIGLWAWLV